MKSKNYPVDEEDALRRAGMCLTFWTLQSHRSPIAARNTSLQMI